jgi:hypothetical protein
VGGLGALSPKGRGDSSPLLRGVKGCVAPPSRGGDKGEGDIFMLLCEPLLVSISARETLEILNPLFPLKLRGMKGGYRAAPE